MLRQSTLAALIIFAVSSVVSGDEPPKVRVGQPAPDFTVTGIDGKTFKLSDKLDKGKKNVCLMFSRANW